MSQHDFVDQSDDGSVIFNLEALLQAGEALEKELAALTGEVSPC